VGRQARFLQVKEKRQRTIGANWLRKPAIQVFFLSPFPIDIEPMSIFIMTPFWSPSMPSLLLFRRITLIQLHEIRKEPI
jgi:hypothetical protein